MKEYFIAKAGESKFGCYVEGTEEELKEITNSTKSEVKEE